MNTVNNGDLNFVVLYGHDNGSQMDVSFDSKAIGFKVTGKTFFNKNGRIESEISYIRGIEKNNRAYIPPEALNGNPLGNSLKTFTQFQYFINQSVSMIYSLNTINRHNVTLTYMTIQFIFNSCSTSLSNSYYVNVRLLSNTNLITI